MVDEVNLSMDRFARDIIGEIILSDNPERVLRKWRGIFGFSQKKLAEHMGITSSVISDYESGRRKSPGITVIKRYVKALLSLDAKRGGAVIKTFMPPSGPANLSKAIIDMVEFRSGVRIDDFCRRIKAPIITKSAATDRVIYGYTIVDSVKAILELSHSQLIQLYGTTTQRALLFTGVTTGKTPLVAIKLTGLQPGLVVLHGIDKVNEVAMNIAEVEAIPVALCRIESIDDVMERLKGVQ
jgi:putative transcriptional regulator